MVSLTTGDTKPKASTACSSQAIPEADILAEQVPTLLLELPYAFMLWLLYHVNSITS